MRKPAKVGYSLHKTLIKGNTYWILMDDSQKLVYPFIDYIIDLIDQKGSAPDSVRNIASVLKIWLQFLANLKVDIFSADDDCIKDFRTHRLNTYKRRGPGDKQAMKRSINIYLSYIYDFYHWLQDEFEVIGLIGLSGCQIRSLPKNDYASGKTSLRYPLKFRNVGEGSKHRMSFIPSQLQYEEMLQLIYSQGSSVAARNALILTIAKHLGWRVGSIASLKVDQFLFSDIQKCNGTDFKVTPSKQKLGYSIPYPVPIAIALQISAYIENERPLILRRFSEDRSENYIFVSDRDGTPLESTAISDFFSLAAKKLGWNGKGRGIHALRRMFTNELFEEELAARLELGLDTSVEAIEMVVAEKLGQKNLDSQRAYVRIVHQRHKRTTVAQFSDKLSQERMENERLRLEISRLKNLVSE